MKTAMENSARKIKTDREYIRFKVLILILLAFGTLLAALAAIVTLVIHDLNLAMKYCDRFLFVKDGEVYAYGGREVMTPETIGDVYGIPVAVESVRGASVVIPLPEVRRGRQWASSEVGKPAKGA